MSMSPVAADIIAYLKVRSDTWRDTLTGAVLDRIVEDLTAKWTSTIVEEPERGMSFGIEADRMTGGGAKS